MIYEHSTHDFHYLVNDEFIAPDSEKGWESLFDSSYLQSRNWVSRTAQGRGDTFFFSWEGYSLVLKRFYRGGAIRHLSKDWYIWMGKGKSRPEKEFVLLARMEEWGMPITRPVAARIRRKGLFYQADMITEELEGVTPLSGILTKRELRADEWVKMGAVIRRFHDRGVCHTDLNAHNVMISDEALYLIDFDNGSVRGDGEWKRDNVERLKRSLLKLKDLNETFYFDDAGWRALLEGYGK